MQWKLCATLLLGSAIVAPGLLAQDFRATITGQVTDISGAAIPGATVKATSVATNATKETITNETGFYTIPYLVPGTYTVEAQLPGFATVKKEGIVLLTADKVNVPFELKVSQIAETVTVTGEQMFIQTETASRGLNFDPIKTQEYPLNGRQVYMLLALTPGVIFTQEQFGSSGFSGTRGWDVNGSYRINGGGNNQFLLNGSPISTTGTWYIAPNVEAIQEFKVMVNTYDAQFGRTGGGTVNTTLKSGTNGWHGSAFDYMRNSVLDANVTQNNRLLYDPSVSPLTKAGAGRGKHIVHQFGGVLGGPIRKDKDFIFMSTEIWREVVPFPVVTSTVPLDLRTGKAFSKYGIQIFDPLTTRVCKAGIDTPAGTSCFGTFIRDPFPDNVIPDSRMSPIGKKILDLYPAPTVDTLTQNFFATGNQGRYRYEQPMVRWDHRFSDKDVLYTLWTYQDGSEFRNQNGFQPPAQIGNVVSTRRQQNAMFDWTHVFSPRTVFNFKVSWGRFADLFPEGESNYDFSYDKLGIKKMPIPPTTDRKTAPRIAVDLFNDIIGNTFSRNAQNYWDVSPNLTQNRGRHTLHYGFEYAYWTRATRGVGRPTGDLSFSRFWTQQYSDRGRGTLDGAGVATILLGYPTSGGIDFNDTFYRTQPYYAVYAQDDWKVARTLTLNLGLRYDIQVPFIERFDRVNAEFDFTAKNPLSDQVLENWRKLKGQYDTANPGKEPYPAPPAVLLGGKTFASADRRRTYDIDWSNIQPRLGLAWQFMPGAVLRTGFGIFHRQPTQGNLTDGYSLRTNYIRSLNGDISPSGSLTGPYSLEDPFPNGVAAPSGSKLGLLTNVGRGVSFDGRQLAIPRTFEYSLGLDFQLPMGIVYEVAYVGSQTVKDTLGAQLGYISMSTFLKGQATPLFLNDRVPNPFFGILPTNSDFGSGDQISRLNLFRPYPLFNGVFHNTNPWARYRYDAFQMKAEKRVFQRRESGILTVIFSYTFSKAFEANHRLNDWNLQEPPIHELSNLDKPQNIAFSGVWDFPLGKGRRWLSNRNRFAGPLLDGWTVDWIWTYYSGYPVGRPDAIYLCDYHVDQQTPTRWFNNTAGCYKDRAPFTLRVVEDRFPDIRNPAKPQLNMALIKNFSIGERIRAQFRGEAFNLTNTPIMPGPNTDFRNPRFGQLGLNQQNFPRNVQVALKIMF